MTEEILSVYPTSETQPYPRVRTSEGRIVLMHRFVMEKHLNRRLSSDEHVHHKNGNQSDFSIDNLQIVTCSKHAEIHSENRTIKMVTLVCPNCEIEFTRRVGQTHLVKKMYKTTYCSKKCVGESSGREAILVHGTINGYSNHKCRCDLCTNANREKMNRYNAKKRLV